MSKQELSATRVSAVSPQTFERCSSDISTIYTYLPRAVKSQIPVLRSIRRSVKMVTGRTTSTNPSNPSPRSSDVYRGPDNQVVTRDQFWQVRNSYVSRPGSPETVASTATSESLEQHQRSLDLLQLPMASERRGGIDWNTAATGMMLWNSARVQLACGTDVNPMTLRSQYIHGLTYLLRALPSDLSELELQEIYNVLPEHLRDDADGQIRRAYFSGSGSRTKPKNILSRSISFAMLQGAVFVSLVLPFFVTLLDRFFKYERQHQITERVLADSVQRVESLGERGLDLKDAVIRFGQGRFGGAVLRGGAWVAEGVLQGVSEGAGKSIVVVGQAMSASSPAS